MTAGGRSQDSSTITSSNASARYGTQEDLRSATRAYGAQCTPDFFGFNAQDELQYRGRLDAHPLTPVANARRELFEAMKQAAETGHGPREQFPSMGSSIK
jgi:hypothetical protein